MSGTDSVIILLVLGQWRVLKIRQVCVNEDDSEIWQWCSHRDCHEWGYRPYAASLIFLCFYVLMSLYGWRKI